MAKENANNKKKALGMGIKALLNNIDDELKSTNKTLQQKTDVSKIQVGGLINLDEIEVNPHQPRIDFDEEALKELSESIKTHGVIQPITVSRLPDGRFRLISGERRWRASKLANLKTIPAYIRSGDNQELIELALLENLQREDLNAIEIALSFKQLMDDCNLTQEQVSERMNKNRSTVTNYLRLLKLPPNIQKSVRDKDISMAHARCISGLNKIEDQLYLFREIKEKGLSVRQTEALAKEIQNSDKSSNTPKVKKANTLPPAYKRIEQDMNSHFETKVTLNRKKNGKGAISIEFYSDQDLERIMEAMQL